MKGIRFYGDRVGSEVVIDAASCPYVLEKVRLDIPPEVKVRRSGEQ